MSKWVLSVTMGIVMIAVVSAAFAQSPAAPPATRPGPDPFLRRAQRALNLTEEQVARLERAFAVHNERTARLRINLARARLDLQEILLAPTTDRARIEEITRRIAGAQGDLAVARVSLQVELRSILTLEQYHRFHRFLRMRMERHSRR